MEFNTETVSSPWPASEYDLNKSRGKKKGRKEMKGGRRVRPQCLECLDIAFTTSYSLHHDLQSLDDIINPSSERRKSGSVRK